MGKLKRCPYCGKEFVSTKQNINYCSDECKIEGKKDYVRQRIEDIRLGRSLKKRNLLVAVKPKVHKCKECGKEFKPKSGKQKYCSFICRERSQYKNRKELEKEYGFQLNPNEQPCWFCDNACGGCSWSRTLKPVKGWKAKPTSFADGTKSYKITYCPEFKRNGRGIK